jgi:hypothetical protein
MSNFSSKSKNDFSLLSSDLDWTARLLAAVGWDSKLRLWARDETLRSNFIPSYNLDRSSNFKSKLYLLLCFMRLV